MSGIACLISERREIKGAAAPRSRALSLVTSLHAGRRLLSWVNLLPGCLLACYRATNMVPNKFRKKANLVHSGEIFYSEYLTIVFTLLLIFCLKLAFWKYFQVLQWCILTSIHIIFFRTTYLRTRASDFPKIENNLSLVLVKLRTKTHFSL